MGQLLIVLIIIALIYVLYDMDSNQGGRSRYMRMGGRQRLRQMPSCQNTLNDIESTSQLKRVPVYDDSARISNKVFWQSDYSHPDRDSRPDLNEAIITPVRPTMNCNGMEYMSDMHKVSRFGSEQS